MSRLSPYFLHRRLTIGGDAGLILQALDVSTRLKANINLLIWARTDLLDAPPVQAGMAVVGGLGCLWVAFFNKQFYWLKGFGSGNKLAPQWSGRLFFGAIGLFFIAAGVYKLWTS